MQTFNVDYSTAPQFSGTRAIHLALPSLNFSYWVVPKTAAVARAGSRDLLAPEPQPTGAEFTNQAINGTPELDYTGTAGLKPIKAWIGDLSLEWYYHPHSALTGALFDKKVINDIYHGGHAQRRSWHARSISAARRARVTRQTVPLEHLGAGQWRARRSTRASSSAGSTSSTMASARTCSSPTPGPRATTRTATPTGAVNTAPPTTFSASLIYDKGPINADVNWDYTSRYTFVCSDCTEVPGVAGHRRSLLLGHRQRALPFFEGLEVYVEGKNLTNAIPRTYLNGNKLLTWAPGQQVGQSASGTGSGYSAYGRTYVFGASYRF